MNYDDAIAFLLSITWHHSMIGKNLITNPGMSMSNCFICLNVFLVDFHVILCFEWTIILLYQLIQANARKRLVIQTITAIFVMMDCTHYFKTKDRICIYYKTSYSKDESQNLLLEWQWDTLTKIIGTYLSSWFRLT